MPGIIDHIGAVSTRDGTVRRLADIKRAAQKWLKSDQMIVRICGNVEECKAGADKMQPNQPTIEAMAAKFGGRTLDGLARKYGYGLIHLVPLE